MKLTEFERLSLYNQYEIMKSLENGNQKDYENYQTILKEGNEGLYYELGDFSEYIPKSIYDETCDILTMFRYITSSLEKLSSEEKEKLNTHILSFEGFDGNNDLHYSVLSTTKDLNSNKWEEVKILNSHSSMSLLRYKGMMACLKDMNKNREELTFEDLDYLCKNWHNYEV
jgi:hypothetical protein